MTDIIYENLTPEELDFISDGCGPSPDELEGLVPELVFHNACREHDVGYYIGGTQADRAAVDWRFYQKMLEAASMTSWWKRWFYRTAAWIYYRFVKQFGGTRWTDGPKKTMKDLRAEMAYHGIV